MKKSFLPRHSVLLTLIAMSLWLSIRPAPAAANPFEQFYRQAAEDPQGLVALSRNHGPDAGAALRCIVLDPGHGGKDKGATSPHGIHEKDVVLAIAKVLKETLEQRIGCKVVLTRTWDRFVCLEERTALANYHRADLFISLHTNAHDDRSAHGIETYFLNFSEDQESARVAALENAASTQRLSDLEAILCDLLLNAKINESACLAAQVQNQIVSTLKASYEPIRDLGIKQAPFQVLFGATMPSILIETAFITNEREESRLRDPRFQQSMANAIVTGIESYVQQMRELTRGGDPS